MMLGKSLWNTLKRMEIILNSVKPRRKFHETEEVGHLRQVGKVTMNIRLATPQDLDAVARLYAEVFNAANPHEHWNFEKALALFRYWMERQPDLFFIAEEDGLIVGGMAVNAKPWFDGVRCQDGELFVHKDYRGRGIGARLFTRVLEEAIERYGARTFESITFAKTKFPKSWYDKLGFKKDDDLMIITGSCTAALEILKRKTSE